MQTHIFAENPSLTVIGGRHDSIESVLLNVADGTDTDDLVVALYLLDNAVTWQGVMYATKRDRSSFLGGVRKWGLVSRFPPADNLPEKYALIRMAFGLRATYPRRQQCRHGWKYRFATFQHDLAYMFGHELHHFRRHHLGLHPHEGEQAATRWGLARANAIGLTVPAERVKKRKKPPKRGRPVVLPKEKNGPLLTKAKLLAGRLSSDDLEELRAWAANRIRRAAEHERNGREARHCEMLRALPEGTILSVKHRAPDEHAGEMVVKIRNLRSSPRIVVKTVDEKVWRYPMVWLETNSATFASRKDVATNGRQRD